MGLKKSDESFEQTVTMQIGPEGQKVAVIGAGAWGTALAHLLANGNLADVLLAWPGADISFMAAENAVGVVYARELKKAENPEELRAKYLEKVQYTSITSCIKLMMVC